VNTPDILMVSITAFSLAHVDAPFHAASMFCVDEATAESIRRAFNEGGEPSAVVELRRHFPLLTDNARGRECVRIIAGWQLVLPLPKAARRLTRSRSKRRGSKVDT